MSSSYALTQKTSRLPPISSFVHMLEEDDFGRPLPNVSPLFNSPSADLILSSSDSFHFKVHRAILSEASPIFEAALVTLPPREPTGPPPVQDLAEDGQTISTLLQFMYPMPNPAPSNLQHLRTALQASLKYEIPSATLGLQSVLVSSSLLASDPLGVYALACEFNLTEEAKEASKATLALDILSIPLDTPYLENITAQDFLRLVRLHQSRATAAIAALGCMSPMPHDCVGYSHSRHDRSESSSRSRPQDGNNNYVRWWAAWKEAAIPEIQARPRTNVIFDSAFLLSHVKKASKHCHECGPSFMSSATQAWLAVLKDRIDALPNTI